jgi:hypothetical protein
MKEGEIGGQGSLDSQKAGKKGINWFHESDGFRI